MMTAQFNHLDAFGISGTQVPARKAQFILATRAQAQLEVIEEMIREEEPGGPSLVEIREPDLARVNYAEAVRGDVGEKWQTIIENLASVPAPHLLERLNTIWTAAERKIGEEVQEKARKIFAERARRKAEIIEEESSCLAAEKGLPAVIRWLDGLKKECTNMRKLIGQELTRYADRKKRQTEAREKLKEEWINLLSSDEEEMGEVARRFLVLAGAAPIVWLILWFFSIPANSIFGLATVILFILLALRYAQPLFRRLRLSRRTMVTATHLTSAYRASSLFELDEMTKRQEMEYAETLRQYIDRLQEDSRKRIALAKARQTDLQARKDSLQGALLDAPPTIRLLLRDGALEEWYQQGRSQAQMTDWINQIASLQHEPDWEEMEREACQAFAFQREVRAEEELYKIYPNRDERMVFLESLRAAAIGLTPGEAFLSLDFAATAGKPLQVHLLVEVEDPETSALAKEINSAWVGTGVGVTIERASDPTAITLIGLVYGYPLEAQKEWESIEADFIKVREEEGLAVYPILFPEERRETP